jgi:hypothetical protein
VGNQILELICKWFIHTIPKYRKDWNDVVDFCNRYDREPSTYKSHFVKNTKIGVLFSDRWDWGFFGNLWIYMGMKGGWLKNYNIIRSESKKKNMKLLESCLTEEMKDEIKRFNK